MGTVQTSLQGKAVILLNGARAEKKTGKVVEIEAPDELLKTVRLNPDAVAFGYVSGKWVAAV